MKITIIAAAAAISLSVGSAYACEDRAGSAAEHPVHPHIRRGCPGVRAKSPARCSDDRSARQAVDPALCDRFGPGHVAVRAEPE